LRASLAQVIVRRRTDAHMTQEFVAHELGVSRQAVSKREWGASEPSTTNLIALAHFFGVEPADLLREVAV
jgi:transcriptional regulator with XRE-family HTH domain